MKNIILYVLVGLCMGACTNTSTQQPPAEDWTTVQYTATDALFPNPERGFYKYSDCNLGTGAGALSESVLKGYRANNITLIFRYFYLKNFRNSPLSAKALEDFDKDMQTIRKAGAKCVLRFAYTSAISEPDAPLNIITQHLDQLKPYLEKNADVIAVMQAGFIGAWGEWYYTSNNLNTPGARYQVLNKILETLPPGRVVQVRTPAYKKEFCQRSTPLIQKEAFSGQNIARIAHHNDCFLASTTDYGTYEDVEADKAYLNKDCLFLPIGGETCPPDGIDPADGLRAYNEMRYLRFSFLNEDYYHGVNDLWVSNGYMDKIIKELGYRFVLSAGEYTAKVAPNSRFAARIILKNVGFASLYNERKVELIIKNTLSGERYKAPLEVEPRLWKPGTDSEIEVEAGIPADVPVGDYILYLNLPDAAETLYGNPDYAIRLANEDVWEPETGYNDLLININIDESNPAVPYSGSLFFEKMGSL
ncbi:MAG: DUF4832 domain-containing protein [Prevotellaceae bacterium]|jgi:hypothetical protein|nr:DUF4832 domain-containing protein [Prevotellaceae bacterium]